ncbi:hypothetical protein LAUMK191_02106 [Mycobacterium attenuatum]|nr:hypothetical protein LAUMK191_02106 [Mycobacterium attenuatum]
MNEMAMGPTPLRMLMGIEVEPSGLPMLMSTSGRTPVRVGMVRGPKVKLAKFNREFPAITGMVKPVRVRTPPSRLIGISTGI